MLQLVYVSTSRANMKQDELAKLVEQSIRNNRRHEITGVLVRRGGHFLQVLEGPKATVEDTFLRIMMDDRHHGLYVLSRKMVTRRQFGEWEMADCSAPELHDAVVRRLNVLIKDAPPSLQERYMSAVYI